MMVRVDDVDAHMKHAAEFGARILAGRPTFRTASASTRPKMRAATCGRSRRRSPTSIRRPGARRRDSGDARIPHRLTATSAFSPAGANRAEVLATRTTDNGEQHGERTMTFDEMIDQAWDDHADHARRGRRPPGRRRTDDCRAGAIRAVRAHRHARVRRAPRRMRARRRAAHVASQAAAFTTTRRPWAAS